MRMKLDQLTIRHLQRLFPACHPGIGRTNDFRFNLPLRFLRSLQEVTDVLWVRSPTWPGGIGRSGCERSRA